ncbi:NAD(P)-dependent alcohol dehydrogenase [Nocardiopsis quinghaiensis]|uniref:NAD(P)-dependent alcohol dehydrogenase n=1 Tax=Nocardiopsis quinghaiensis TaxID=464995 RepID=UPI00123A1F06|nr:NAD(P)-dependent alcohol dehydrogenase [Nocardiopsis quinghaiensis]
MRAVVFEDYEQFPSLKDVPKPEPGPGEVLLRVAGSGACHSDISVYRHFREGQPGAQKPPFVLGHENSGWVEALGEGVSGRVEVGGAYLVYGPTGCGHCRRCARGQDTYCENAATVPHMAVGLGRDGGMAEYMTAPAHHLVPLGDADPVDAAPLSDAGLTPYHAVKEALPHLEGGGRHALVIGLGGLGQIGVQILRALTGATVIATDLKEEARAEAEAHGAITVGTGERQVEEIREVTGGRGVDAAFDFVGASPTITTAAAVMAQGGRLTVVGIAGGTHQFSFFTNPYESYVTNTYWGTVGELWEVVDMYRAGQIRPEVERFSMDEALDAYRKLEEGEVFGRAVVVPGEG